MAVEALTPAVRRLNESMQALAAIGGALRLEQTSAAGDPAVTAAMATIWGLLGLPESASLTREEKRQALGLIQAFFIEAADMLDKPERAPGWAFEDPAILQGLGASSASLVGRIEDLSNGRPWLAAALQGSGTFLDVGTGVGGIALAAAAAWEGLTVVGIDRWAPALALAERNRAASAHSVRVRFECRPLESVDEAGRYSLVWVSTPFISGPAIFTSMPRLLAALRPGGGLILGVTPPPEEALGAALTQLRTLRNGGRSWTCEELAALMRGAGFADVEIPDGQAGTQFVIGRRSEP